MRLPLVADQSIVLLYSSIQRTRSQKAENAEALLQLLHRVPSLHLPEGFEIVWTFLSGGGSSNLASSTALLTIGKDPGGRGHLVLYTVSSVSGAVVPLKIHLLSHPNPISAAYQVRWRHTTLSDCIRYYSIISNGNNPLLFV